MITNNKRICKTNNFNQIKHLHHSQPEPEIRFQICIEGQQQQQKRRTEHPVTPEWSCARPEVQTRKEPHWSTWDWFDYNTDSLDHSRSRWASISACRDRLYKRNAERCNLGSRCLGQGINLKSWGSERIKFTSCGIKNRSSDLLKCPKIPTAANVTPAE